MEDEGNYGWRIVRHTKGRGVVRQSHHVGVAEGKNQQGARQRMRYTMTASAIAQTIPAKKVPREIAIIAREPEENATTLMIIAAWVAGSVLISKAIFMPRAMAIGGKKGESLRKGAAKAPA
jgi:hypothetical protein